MSLVCYNDYIENTKEIHLFLNNNPEIKHECLTLFSVSPKEGITKLTEYLDKVNLNCSMYYKKNVLKDLENN